MSGYISCELVPSVTLGSSSGLATWHKLFWFWSSKAGVMGLDCFCRSAAMWVVVLVCHSVLPHSERLSAVLFCRFSGATILSSKPPDYSLCFLPWWFWLPLTLNECLAFRGLQLLISRGRSAAHQYAGRKDMFPFSQPYSLGDLQIWF